MSGRAFGKQIIDQAAHALVGALVVALLMVSPRAIAAVLCMLALAVLREIGQHDGFDLGKGSVTDLAFFAVGGVGVAYVMPAWLAL